jgi:hypothetical protein
LGEPELRDKISQRLRERCADLLAATPAEKVAIERLVRDIYDARSSVVHTGKNELRDQLLLLESARHLVERVIAKTLPIAGAHAK